MENKSSYPSQRSGFCLYHVTCCSTRPGSETPEVSCLSHNNDLIFISSHFSIAATLSPEDPEIAFNLAAVLEASKPPLHCPYIYLNHFFSSGEVGRSPGTIPAQQRSRRRGDKPSLFSCPILMYHNLASGNARTQRERKDRWTPNERGRRT